GQSPSSPDAIHFTQEPWEGSCDLPRWARTGRARPPPTRSTSLRNPGRVPATSRDGLGRAEPVLPRRDPLHSGTLGGFLLPPAMGSDGQSPSSPDAIHS